MSSKQSPSKSDPRIAPKEVMVTRHKSAQMKRQLRVKNRSMKHLTDLLKSPTKEMNTAKIQAKPKSPKIKQSLLKSVAKVQKLPEKVFTLSKMLRKKIVLVQDEEYYPNKVKRKTEVKKVKLKPSHELKMVGSITGSVKRKSTMPHKATSKRPKQARSPVYAGLSMAEIIRMVEDDLTDEDMMEILTCPSPVWWEDPPDEEYIEDAIFTQPPPKKDPVTKLKKTAQKNKEVGVPSVENLNQTIEMPNLKSKSDKFLKKRSKLEDLLGNIKKCGNKVNQSKKHLFNDDVTTCSNHQHNDGDVSIETINNDINNKTDVNSNNNDNADVTKKTKSSNDNKNANNETRQSDNDKRGRLSESDGDEILFHDSGMNEDELLKSLENMDIPIENRNQNDVIVIDDEDDDDLGTANKDKEIKPDISNAKDKKLAIKRVFKPKSYSNEKLNVTSKNMSVLEECICSPKSSDSSSSKTTSTSRETDTISDTNIRFLDDGEEIKNFTVGDEKIKNSSKDGVQIEPKEYKDEANASITVYKIIEEITDSPKADNDNIKIETTKQKSEDRDEKSATINDYYKKCKKVYQKKFKRNEDKTDINKNDVKDINKDIKFEIDEIIFCELCKPKAKKVSDDKNVKYCLKCSSIFDSTDCTYCIKKSKAQVFNCSSCTKKFCCEKKFKSHVEHAHRA